jgi:hypothetical protein
MGMTEGRSYRVTAPDGTEVEVEARGPHQAAIAAMSALGQDGLITYPDRRDDARPRWRIRWVGEDLPCWLIVIR